MPTKRTVIRGEILQSIRVQTFKTELIIYICFDLVLDGRTNNSGVLALIPGIAPATAAVGPLFALEVYVHVCICAGVSLRVPE